MGWLQAVVSCAAVYLAGEAIERGRVLAACPRVSGGAFGGPVGTAVCVGVRDGAAYLLTAEHVVPRGEARAYEFFTPASRPNPARQLSRGEVVVRLTAADVALVRLPLGDADPPPVVRLARPGERPNRYPVVAAAVGCPAAAPPAHRGERVTGKRLVRRPAGGVAFFWQVDEVPVGGMSGGPLVWDGRVIGVCSAAQGGAGYFSHLDEILYGLIQSGYGWLTD